MQKSGIAATREKIPLALLAPRRRQRKKPHVSIHYLSMCIVPGRLSDDDPSFPRYLSCSSPKSGNNAVPPPSPQTDTDVWSKSQLLPCSIILPSPLRRGKKGSQLTEHCVQKSHEIYTSRSRGGGWACGQNAVSSVLFVLPSPAKRSFERLYPPPFNPPPLPPLFQATAEAGGMARSAWE